MRILFVTSTRIGDAVLSTGLLAHLIETHPEARFTIACGPVAAPLFGAVPGLERLIIVRKKRYGLHWLELWAAVAGRRWDMVVDLRASALAWLLRARRRAVLRRSKAPVHRLREHARTLGLEEAPAPRLWTTPAHAEAAARLVPAGGPVLAVGPTANWAGKQWRAERFAELIARLTGPGGILPGARIALFGAPGERPAALPVIEAVPEGRRIDLVGRVDPLTAYACLEHCAFYVGNDSGLMHIAAAAGVPTLGLFGPSREEHYAPWGTHTAVARTPETYDELVGAPGYDHRTTGTLMDGLGVDAVEAAARDLWRRAGRAGGESGVTAPRRRRPPAPGSWGGR
jgi:ADP-heptose:LPS heptosyltransferase